MTAIRPDPECNEPADPMNDLDSTARLPVLARPHLRKVWVAAAIVLVLLLVGAGVGLSVVARARAIEQRRAEAQQHAAEAQQAAVHRTRAAELGEVYEAVLAVQSAADDGVTFVDYAIVLQEAAATLVAYAPPDEPARAVRTHLAAAMDRYQVAYALMQLMVDFGGPAEASRSWFSRYRRQHAEIYAGEAATGRDALQDSWRSARLEMDAARAALAAYGSGG